MGNSSGTAFCVGHRALGGARSQRRSEHSHVQTFKDAWGQFNILSTPFQHPFDALSTPFQHPFNTLSTPFQHPFNTLPTPFQHPFNTLSTPFQRPFNALSTPFQHPFNTLPTIFLLHCNVILWISHVALCVSKVSNVRRLCLAAGVVAKARIAAMQTSATVGSRPIL